jgi:SDR family mycofactocin-dependent oxidoreductase
MGRAHAVAYAREGAAVVALDISEQVSTAPGPTATSDDLEETRRQVEELGARIVTATADVRDYASVKSVVDRGLEEFGHIDVVVANAGIASTPTPFWEIDEQTWEQTIDINLTGAWRTVKAAVPAMIGGNGAKGANGGGSIVLTSSVAGLKGVPTIADYVASKHGVLGLMRAMAQELAQHNIRVNSVHPTNVWTPMFDTPAVRQLFAPGVENLSDEAFHEAASGLNLLPVGWVHPEDVSSAVLWLTSDEARYVTGVALPVDAGCITK